MKQLRNFFGRGGGQKEIRKKSVFPQSMPPYLFPITQTQIQAISFQAFSSSNQDRGAYKSLCSSCGQWMERRLQSMVQLLNCPLEESFFTDC